MAASRVGAASTNELIEIHLRRHLHPRIGDVPLGKLRPIQVQNVIAALTETHAASTVHTIAQHLAQVLNGAVNDGLLVRSPAKGLKLPRADAAEIVIPTPERVHTIAAHIEPRYRALVAVGAGLGLRQGEAFGLSLDRVGFLRRTVRIERHLKRARRQPLGLGDVKTRGSTRSVPLPENVAHELAQHIAAFPNDDPDGLLFVTPSGVRLRATTWNRKAWKPAVAGRGNRHRLPRAAPPLASALIRKNLAPAVIARRMATARRRCTALTPTSGATTSAHGRRSTRRSRSDVQRPCNA